MGKSKKAVERRVKPLVVRLISWSTARRTGRVASYSVAHVCKKDALTGNDNRTLCGTRIPRHEKWLLDDETRERNKCSACQWLLKQHTKGEARGARPEENHE